MFTIEGFHYVRKRKQVSELFEQKEGAIEKINNEADAIIFVLTQHNHQHQKQAS